MVRRRTGFTLTELLVAVTILIVVIVATAKIFGTVGRVAGLGEAGSAVLQEAGVTVAFYSDTIRNPSEVLAGARKAVEAGLAHDDAVRAFTLSAAEIFGVADRLGSLDVGKIANLVVTDGDLLDDSTKVQFVFVDGQRFEPEDDNGGQAGRRAGGRGGRGGPDGAGERAGRRAGGQGEEGGQEGEEGPSDTELRSRIGGSLRGPYRDDDVMLIRNATVMTVTNGTIENGSILIRNGKIAAVGTNISAPRGAHVIDAQGQYVIPGIIDAHSHIAGGSNEGAVAVSAMVGIKDVVNPDDIGIYRGLAGGVTTANVLHGSANPIGGQNQVIKLRWGALPEQLKFGEAPEGIKFALGENVKQSNWGDDYKTRYPQTRMGVEQIMLDRPVNTDLMPVQDALKLGADAMFDEKYGEDVRVVSVGAGVGA